MPLHEREIIREQMEDCVFADRDLTRPVAEVPVPRGRDAAEACVPGGVGRADARRQRPPEPGHVLPDVGGARGSRPDGPVDQQEHDRQGRVPADRRDRAAVRAHAGRSVECARGRQHGGHLGHRLLRSLHARGHGGQVAVAGQATGRRQADGQAEHGVRSGAGGLAQVRPLLGHRDARGADVPGPLHDGSGRHVWSGWTRTRSWSSRRSASPTPAPTSRWRPCPRRWTSCRPTRGLDIDIHVDGASGGFLAPFCAPEVVFDFRLPRVKSISASGHKFGLAPLGVGWVVWRDPPELPDDLIFHVNYLGGDMPVFQINFSRPAGQIVAQYYNFLRLGYEGYRASTMRPTRSASTSPPRSSSSARSSCCVTATRTPASRRSPGGSAKARTPATRCSTWPTGCAPEAGRYPPTPSPAPPSDIPVQRILVRLGVSQDMASLLLDDFQAAVAHFSRHPVTVPMSKEEASGFSHL